MYDDNDQPSSKRTPRFGKLAILAITLLAAIGMVGLTTAAAAPVQEAKLTADDGAEDDQFGDAVAVDGDTTLVGARGDDDNGSASGSASVFTRNGTTWTQQAKLNATDAAAGNQFGWSVALDGDTALVGAAFDDDGGPSSGSAYVFTRSGTMWSQQAKITATDAAAGDRFADAVALDVDTALVGAPFDDDAGSSSGSASVFTRNGTTWTQQAKLNATDAVANDLFGDAVAVDGDTALVGSPLDDDAGSSSGSAYVFTRSGTMWSQQAKITADDAAAGDHFGWSVALDGDTALVGAPSDDDRGASSGSAYVFDLAPAGDQQPPACPENLTAEAQGNEDVSLSWNASVDADRYPVYRATGDGPFVHLANVTSTSYTDNTTGAETTYTYEVTAANEAGEAEDCPTAEVTAVPFFGTTAIIALAVLGTVGIGAVLWARRG